MMTCKHFSLLDEEYITSLHTFYGTGRPFVVCRLSSICLSDRPSVVCNVCAPCSKGRSFRQYFCIIIAQGLGQFVLKFWAKIRRASSGSCKLNRRGYEKLPAATSESMHLSTSTHLPESSNLARQHFQKATPFYVTVLHVGHWCISRWTVAHMLLKSLSITHSTLLSTVRHRARTRSASCCPNSIIFNCAFLK